MVVRYWGTVCEWCWHSTFLLVNMKPGIWCRDIQNVNEVWWHACPCYEILSASSHPSFPQNFQHFSGMVRNCPPWRWETCHIVLDFTVKLKQIFSFYNCAAVCYGYKTDRLQQLLLRVRETYFETASGVSCSKDYEPLCSVLVILLWL